MDLRELRGHRPDGAGRRRHQHGLSGYRTSDLQEAEVGREARDPKSAQDHGKWLPLLDAIELLGRRHGKILPARHALDDVARSQRGVIGADHLPQRHRSHHAAGLDGVDIGAHRAHPGTVGGIHRDVERAGQRLTRTRLGHRGTAQLKIAFSELIFGSVAKNPLAVHLA